MSAYVEVLISGYSFFYNGLVSNKELLSIFPVRSVTLMVEMITSKSKKEQ